MRASPSLPEDIRATLVRVLAYMGGLGILAITAFGFLRTPAVVAAIDSSSPQPQWIKVDRPYPAFELKMPDLAAGPFDYTILRRPADGARKDILTWGGPAGTRPYALVEIYRAGSRTEPFIDAPSEIAARILGLTVTDDVQAAGEMSSKFGTVPLVDFAVAAAGKERRCLGFARAFEAPPMQIAGWYCNAGAAAVDRAKVACVLDHLTIISAGGDARLDEFFARAEVKRTFCNQRNPIFAATPERAPPNAAPHRLIRRDAKLHEQLRTR